MKAPTGIFLGKQQTELIDEVKNILGGALGGHGVLSLFNQRQTFGQIAKLYALLFFFTVVVPYLGFTIERDPAVTLFHLTIWVNGFICVAATAAMWCNKQVVRVIEGQIVSNFSDELARRTLVHMRTRLSGKKPDLVAVTAALVAYGIVVWAISRDLELSFSKLPAVFVSWSIAWLYVLYSSARATYVCTFYVSMSACFEDGQPRLFSLDPANSPIVLAIIDMASRILWFWAFVSLSVGTLIPLFDGNKNFVAWTVTLSVLLSFVLGFTMLLVVRSRLNILISENYRGSICDLQQMLERYCGGRLQDVPKNYEQIKETLELYKQLVSARRDSFAVSGVVAVAIPLFGQLVGLLGATGLGKLWPLIESFVNDYIAP